MIDGIEALIDLALWEDVGHQDVTTRSVVGGADRGSATVLAKEDFLLCGLAIFSRVFSRLSEDITITPYFGDGDTIKPGDVIAGLAGPLQALLTGERTALNFLQRLSGIATLTRQAVNKVAGYPVRILDTRKTTPGWRALEKEAVKVGGGSSHRWGLFDGVLIKDNHIRAVGSIEKAVVMARSNSPVTLKIEVEVNTLEEVEEALRAKADIIMLDNMSLSDMQCAVKKIRGRSLVEASGGITFDNLQSVASTGVDFISMGALTYASRAVDISMELGAKDN